MNADQARALLADQDPDDGPVALLPSVLQNLTALDLPDGVAVEVGAIKDNVIHLEWEGRLYRDGGAVLGEAEYVWTRKYWYSPLGLEQYLDLVRRAVETRNRVRGDVELSTYEDDGVYIHLSYVVRTVRRISSEPSRLRRRSPGKCRRRPNRPRTRSARGSPR